MHQDSNGNPPQRVEGAQDVHGRGGVEAEDRLPAIQYYEGLKQREEQKARQSENASEAETRPRPFESGLETKTNLQDYNTSAYNDVQVVQKWH